jgi:hypothetical protein
MEDQEVLIPRNQDLGPTGQGRGQDPDVIGIAHGEIG